jgi:hypothetical protein
VDRVISWVAEKFDNAASGSGMKLFVDLNTRRFVRSATSTVALPALFLKRRDKMQIEIVYLERGAPVFTPPGTYEKLALKSKFSNSNFIAVTNDGTLDLFTQEIEDLFVGSAASVDAYLELIIFRTDETIRTETLQVQIENSVILLNEGTPDSVPTGRATFEEAIAGTSNNKWMTPLLVSELINNRDDVQNFAAVAAFPATGETGKIYMVGATAYAWTGTGYEKISRDSVFNSLTPPTDPQEGDRWVDSNTFIAYDYVNGAWIQTAV